MIRNISALGVEAPPLYDVCIVGSGPAGLTVARELAQRGLRIAVLESGTHHVTAHGDALREVESDGIHVTTHSRERVLGGASSTWAGLSAPLDPIDFAHRPWVRLSGWPIPLSELYAWYKAAATRYRFPAWEFFAPEGAGRLLNVRASGDLQPDWLALEEKLFLAADPPQRFGVDWPEIWGGADTDVWLDATVTSLETDEAADVVHEVVVRSATGATYRLRSKVFVLAAGGIENARLLLASRSACPRGLGNEADQVGRYLMNHPKGNWGVIRFQRPLSLLPLYFGFRRNRVAGYVGLRLAEPEQARLGVLNSYLRLEPIFDWTDSAGVNAFVAFARQMRRSLQWWTKRRRHPVVELRSPVETGDDSELLSAGSGWSVWRERLQRIAGDLPNVARYAKARLTGTRPRITAARIRNFMEMEPEGSNRVELSSNRDVFGAQLPRVVHRPTDLDKRSLLALHQALSEELDRSNLGRIEYPTDECSAWPVSLDASHHIGTTRMGVDACTSVVSPSLQVHGVRNVYVAGSSVFPTSGCANPTLTIVALSMRLAAHLTASHFSADLAPAAMVDELQQ